MPNRTSQEFNTSRFSAVQPDAVYVEHGIPHVQQSHGSALLMSEPNATRVNCTNPFTGSRHYKANPADLSKEYPHPFEQVENSYTYTLHPPPGDYPQQQVDSYYDEDSSETSSDCSDQDVSDESSLTDYQPSEKVKTYFSNQAEMQHYFNHQRQKLSHQQLYQNYAPP